MSEGELLVIIGLVLGLVLFVGLVCFDLILEDEDMR